MQLFLCNEFIGGIIMGLGMDGLCRIDHSRWTEKEKQLLHDTSMKILKDIGVKVFCEEAVQLLKGAGVTIEGDLVKIDESLVKEALETAPREFSLFTSDGTEEMKMVPDSVYFGTGTDMPDYCDLYTGEIRNAVLKDCEDATKVGHACKNIDWIAPFALSNDKDPRVSDMYHFKAMRKYSNKPNLTIATDVYSLKGLIDMAAEQAGGYEELRAKPTMVHYAEPISPLLNAKEATEKLLLCAEYGVPITYTSGIIAGATGPVTLAGTLALGNAECLAGLVIHQLKRKGSPFMYGIASSIMDMKTTISAYGGPEFPLMNIFVGEMGRFYKLPSFGISGASDSNECDLQFGAEAMYSVMCAIHGRTNFNHDNGYMGAGQMGSLQSILAADEIIQFAKRYEKGIEISEETLSFDTIEKVGHGGTFLTEKETVRKFKKEYFLPKFMNRDRHMIWTDNGSITMEEKLREKAKEIIENDPPVFINEELSGKFDRLIKEHEEFYGVK